MKFPFFSNRPRPRMSMRQRRCGRRHAAALVETALCLTFVLLPVTLGAFQFGMVFMTTHALQQATRESARFASVHYNDSTFDLSETQGNSASDTPSLLHVIRSQVVANGISWREVNGSKLSGGSKGGSIVITPDAEDRKSGEPLTISITYPMRQRALLGALFFQSANGKQAPMSLGFLKNDYTASSTVILE